MKKLLIALMSIAILSGVSACASPEEKAAKKEAKKNARIEKRTARLQSETAFALGVDKSAVQISNVTGNMSGYRWRANVGSKAYNCAMYGGNFLVLQPFHNVTL